MDTRLLSALLLTLAGFLFSGSAQAMPITLPTWQASQWWRNCASLDLDFYNDRYYINSNSSCDGTVGTTYSGITNFITGAGATFSRSGSSNVTSTEAPFYLGANQTFVSRASGAYSVTYNAAPFYMSTGGGQTFTSRATTTTNVTSISPPFYLAANQAFVSRASSGTYFDSTGTLQTATTNTARTNYIYNGSTWVNSGTLIEPAATNSIRNNTMAGGTAAAVAGENITNGTFAACSGSSCTSWTTTVNGGTGTVTFGSNAANVTGDGTNEAAFYQAITTVANHSYTVTITTSGSNAVTLKVGTTAGGSNLYTSSIAANATIQRIFKATGTTTYVQLGITNAVTGTVTSVSVQDQGIVPTNWVLNTNSSGLIPSIVGTGTDHGISYVDVNIAGTAVTSTEFALLFEANKNIAASSGQAWTNSVFLQISGGSTSNITSIYTVTQEQDSGDVNTRNDAGSNIKASIPTSGALSAYQAATTSTLSMASTAWVLPYIGVFIASGSTVNITLRVGMPQLEKNLYATSVISTSSGAVTRSADIYSMTTNGTYFDNTGTLQTSTTSTVRDNHNFTSPYADLGNLIEPAATNYITNNTMVGAVAATTITPVTVSNMTSSGTTVTVTTATAHNLYVGNIVYFTGTSDTAYNGAYTVASVPSSTTFTYTVGAAPSTSPPTTLGSYTAQTGGTGPIGWNNGNTGTMGMAMVIAGTGTEYSMNYTDVRFFGIWNGTGNGVLQNCFTSLSSPTASANQTWATSFYARLAAGSTSHVSVSVSQNWLTSGGGYISENGTYLTGSLSSTPQRYFVTGTAPATTGIVASYIKALNFTVGQAFDITVRVYAPQLEQNGSATSPILTQGATVARSADVFSQEPDAYFDSTGKLQYAAANAARTNYTYNGSTWTSAGTLIEPAATNVLPNSSLISAWTAGLTTSTTQNATSPDGSMDAWTLTQTGASGTDSRMQQNITVTNDGSTYTASVYIAKTTGTPSIYPALGLNFSGGTAVYGQLILNTTTGAYTNTAACVSPTVTAEGNFWRVSCTVSNNTSGNTTMYIQLYPAWNANGTTTESTVTNGSTVFYGPQIEKTAFATSYIPTYGTIETRSADVYSAPNGGTYYNSSGLIANAAANTPRMDHDPLTGLSKGILIEESKTNMVAASQDEFSNSTYWCQNCGSRGTTMADDVTATLSPDGTYDASSMTTTTLYGYTSPIPCATITAGTTYTASVYVQKASLPAPNQFELEGGKGDNTDGGYVVMNLSSGGTVCGIPASGVAVACGSQALPNNWFRLWVAFQTTSSTQGCLILTNNNTTYGTTYLYGAQLELGSFPTSYIPTNNGTVTRAADVLTIPTTASGGWYNATGAQGTLAATGSTSRVNPAGYPGLASIDDGTSNNAIHLYVDGSSLSKIGAIYAGGTLQSTGTPSSYTLGNTTKGAITFQSGTSNVAFDAANASSGTPSSIPSVSVLRVGFGRGGSSGLAWDGWVNHLWYMPVVEPSASLPDFTH